MTLLIKSDGMCMYWRAHKDRLYWNMRSFISHSLAHVLSFMPSHSQAHPPTQTHTIYQRAPLSSSVHESYDVSPTSGSSGLPCRAARLFIWTDPELSAQTRDTSRYTCTTDTHKHTNTHTGSFISSSHLTLTLTSPHLTAASSEQDLHLPHGLSRLILSASASFLPSHLPSFLPSPSPAEHWRPVRPASLSGSSLS